MTTRVRPYNLADKPACLAVFDSNIPTYFDASERDDFAAFLDDPKGTYYVVEQNGKPCGCGGIAREENGQARFTWGMVANALHGAGLGKCLAEHRLREIEKAGDYTAVELFTTPQVAPFFAKFGFETRTTEKDGFAPGMDKVQMIRPLSGHAANGIAPV